MCIFILTINELSWQFILSFISRLLVKFPELNYQLKIKVCIDKWVLIYLEIILDIFINTLSVRHWLWLKTFGEFTALLILIVCFSGNLEMWLPFEGKTFRISTLIIYFVTVEKNLTFCCFLIAFYFHFFQVTKI